MRTAFGRSKSAGLHRIKRLIHDLLRYPRVVHAFRPQLMDGSCLRLEMDSGFARDFRTRRSPIVIALCFGAHLPKASLLLQSTTSLSRREADYYTCDQGDEVSLGAQAILYDWRVTTRADFETGSWAAKGISSCPGVGPRLDRALRVTWSWTSASRHPPVVFSLRSAPLALCALADVPPA